MCAICGIIYFEKEQKIEASEVRSMMACMQHRGPDEEGMYISGNVALGHRRLSIIDLKTGKQPISNEDGKLWIVYNGEIYNFCDLRKDLEKRGHFFRTKTDTEVIIHAYEEYKEEFLKRLRGMFAFAIWDEKKKKLFLARDRIGIKPLYYCITNDFFIFASEMKAILSNKNVSRKINLKIIDRFLTYHYIPGEETLIEGIKKLEPGHFLTLIDGRIEKAKYWDLKFPKEKNLINFDDAKNHLMGLLRESARIHMVSDVPVGILLSGGIDSSALLGLCANETNREISTFTIGFENAGFDDERYFARIAANKYGTKHIEATITAEEFKSFLPDYVWYLEDPVSEPPAIALYYVTKLARNHVKVLISGEGGDEAFAGYPNYRNMLLLEWIKKYIKGFELPLSKELEHLALSFGMFRLQKYAKLLSVPQEDYYLSRTSTPYNSFNKVYKQLYTKDFLKEVDKKYSTLPTRYLNEQLKTDDPLSRMLYIDTKTWLPDDLLIKADKITMAASVELRVPLLDHMLLEFAATLPSHFKVRNLKTKFILKEVLKNIVPSKILKKKKTGFPVPIQKWLTKDLRKYVEEILLSQEAIQRGYFRKRFIGQLLKDENITNSTMELFSLIVLELWHRTFVGPLRRI